MSGDPLREQWLDWARGQAIPSDRLEAAVDAAQRMAGTGAGSQVTAAVARLAGGLRLPADAALADRERTRASTVLEEVGSLSPAGALTAEALGTLQRLFGARRDALADALAAVVPAAQPSPDRASVGPTLREFFGEHSILLLSYVGAFLLVVAAILYEVYAFGQLSGGMRFAGVLGLELVFGGGGWACLRSPRMRLVGHTYVAVFAMLAPLVCAAAYVFLGQPQHRISGEVALLLSGCALIFLYGALCLRLRSHAYGYLALAAIPVAWLGGINAAGPGSWHGPVAAMLVAVYALASFAAKRTSLLGERFARRAVLFTYGAAVLAAALALPGGPVTWTTTTTVAVIGAGFLLARLLAVPGQALNLLAAATAGSLAVLGANAALGAGDTQTAITLLVLAACWGLGAEVTDSAGQKMSLRIGLAVQALAPIALVHLPAGDAAGILLTSTALLTAVAWRSRAPMWLLLAGAALIADWYWLGRALVIPVAASATTLALLYSPLPALLGATGLGLRAAAGRRWALPVYSIGAAVALAVVLMASNAGAVGLAGRALIAYATVAYVAAVVERSAPAVVVAVIGAAGGLLLALVDTSTAPVLALGALTLLAVVVYAGHVPWQARPDVAGAHRYSGLAGAGASGLAAFTLSDATHPGSPEALLAALLVLAFAALLAFEGRRAGAALSVHAAVVTASLASYFAARYLDATNPQWYVAAPGLALAGTGLRMPRSSGLAQVATSTGATLLLGTTAIQGFADASWGYTAWLVAEAIGAVLAGIAMRSRALVLAGAVAVGVSGLRALFVLVQQGLLFAAFGAAAVFLLGLGAGLAALRDRFRGPLGTAWREWS